MSPASARRAPGPVDGLYAVGEDLDPHLPGCPPEQAWLPLCSCILLAGTGVLP